MSRISIIYVGIALMVIGWVAPYFLLAVFPASWITWMISANFETYISSLPGIGMVLIAAGVLVRLFSPSRKSSGVENPSLALNTSSAEKDFRFWRTALLAGFVIWFMALLGTFMAFDSGPSFTAYTLLYLHLLALPVAITCLVVAHIKRKTDVDRAVFILKLPFYYGVGVIVLVFGSSLLGLGL